MARPPGAGLKSRHAPGVDSAVRLARSLLSSILLSAAGGTAVAQDSPSLNGYVTLANGYWSRGLSQNDGLSVQLGIDYQLGGVQPPSRELVERTCAAFRAAGLNAS